MDVISRIREASQSEQEIQDSFDSRYSITSDKTGIVVVRCEMVFGVGVGYEWCEELHAERNEVLYEK